jgi:uncharacterized 2Fe-2S/4Fe-4S cluster protein (DUF4445 family)
MNTEDEAYAALGVRYAKALNESMKKTMEDTCKKIEGFNELTELQQEFVKKMALANVGAHFGGFKKEKE